MPKKATKSAERTSTKAQDRLAIAAFVLVVTSVLSLVAALVISATGTATPAVGKQILPGFLVLYPQIGLSLGALCIIAVVLIGVRNRKN